MTQSIVFTYTRIEPARCRSLAKAIGKLGRNERPGHWIWKFAAWLALVFLMIWVLRLDALQEVETTSLIGAFSAGVLVMMIVRVCVIWMTHKRMYSALEQGQKLQGPISVQLGPEGCRFESPLINSHVNWQAVEEILDLKTGTGLRSGLFVYPLPNEALPDGMSPENFREKLEAWRATS
ncbi:hypothetical protein [Pelagibius sp. Alg239-R121]|uniref:hypothetical protein n=1 Tax=Pelagibius sp. Alg239-R121 TaxID=2993448 RepID=UPI0024A661CD|nr:hypothetical protein [Pelagibius sp. Alg239-R121]